ncbi:MAG TPA: DUF5671 domain-containing protein [Candidatus Paceibacterota bacterium]|nr:DUF5671 domain-containing protein [Candidatus Paceibacterota bacterium]
METAPVVAPSRSKTTPRDFFLWAGAVIALYGSVISLTTLLFEYVNHAFPDPLAYSGDMYGGAVRAAMAGVIVLVPTTLILLRIIRKSIEKDAGKAEVWVRRWALVLTVFIAVAVILVDLITLITTFLGGELSVRFGLKVAVVLLIALGVFMHFLADLKGYWITHARKANLVGIGVGVLALVSVVAGFFIIGSPTDLRMIRYDEQKVYDLQSIQYQVVNYYQQKGSLPADLEYLNDPISSFMTPVDEQTGEAYRYAVTGPLSFELCAVFNRATPDMDGKGAYAGRDMSYPAVHADENWQHEEGETCFTRTIDPERYPLFEKPMF